ncbi:Histidine kinase-, DNA gyrase B-, and HSP90-like ATPase [Cnuella takakiae]|uniref:histidine kinase n=1 Tax=Cnuella takakiae TaxID=1302690 RepID=A0A1M5D9G3_9BACT|nr:HAMP domain-containing sensor histidine kinase [Cnuella takakiae]OLY94060.1 hypothetical protein BUE76_20820 [Cnuella takakiae]SHF63591.1 Histidine kinase-, DNA gyrase B-, and HSP90-like ATPase [Cnuella takakiae]
MQPTKTAAQLQEEKEKIISLLLHDLRPPLQVLRFLTGHLAGSNGASMSPEMIQAYMQELNMAVEELVQSSSAIFTWLEVQRDRFAGKPQEISISGLLQKTIQQFKEDVPNNSSELVVDATQDVSVMIDAPAVQVALIQLLRNATTAAKGSPVRLHGRKEGSWLYLSVQDSGKGISEKVTESIKAHLKGDMYHPLLYRYGYRIVVKVMELLGGAVQFTIGQGTTATLAIPV